MSETHVLGGRTFTSIGDSSIGHDIWFRARLREAGLVDVEIGEAESHHDFALRLLDEASSSEKLFELLGGLLLPEGVERWTPALALETGDFLFGLTGKDKEAVRMLICSLLIRFFQTGVSSLHRSHSSSERTTAAHAGSKDQTSVTEAGAS